MTSEEKNKVLHDAIKEWGTSAQILMAIEECAELIVALCHGFRKRLEEGEVETEIADVQIMLDQLRLIFDNAEIDNQLEYKFTRLHDRILDYKHKHRDGKKDS